MRLRWFICSLATVLSIGAVADAATIITTKYGPVGKGADAEVRENETNTNLAGFQGTNRGNLTELGMRVTQKTSPTTFNPVNNSSFYTKFYIGNLPATSDTAFWDNKKVYFRVYTRNSVQFRAWQDETISGNPHIPLTEYNYQLRALDPNGVYNDGALGQQDMFGNNYTASHYDYDWTEGTGTTTGITAYNAPGRKVRCITQACVTANGASLGRMEEYDADPNTVDLGRMEMPNRDHGNRLAQRFPLTYRDPNDVLKQLIMDAKDAGRDTVTIISFQGFDETNFLTTPNQLLNGINNLIAPKEQTTIIAAQPNDNADGRYSPQLIFIIPEPASFALLGLGCVAALVVRRRKS
jgi:PEP-CTERM motif